MVWFEGNSLPIIHFLKKLKGTERDYIMRVRNGEFELADLVKETHKLVQEIDSLKPWPLPEKVEKEF